MKIFDIFKIPPGTDLGAKTTQFNSELDTELILDALCYEDDINSTMNVTEKNGFSSGSLISENKKAFMLENTNFHGSTSKFLVYKRKDAKIAWPSAVSLLCNK